MAIDVLGVDNVLVGVEDIDEATDFYANRLGLPVKFAFPQRGLVAFRLGKEEPALIARRQEVRDWAPHDSPRVWLEVPDARAAGEALRQAGIRTLGEPFQVNTGWAVEFRDPWGNVFGLTDYVKAPERGRRPR